MFFTLVFFILIFFFFFLFYSTSVFFFFFLSMLLLSLLVVLSFLFFKSEALFNFITKMDTYECGFSELYSYNSFYTMQFFLIALSFMLFDLEIIFIMPVVLSESYSFFSYIFGVLFLFFLMVSLFFEFLSSKVMWSAKV